MKCLKLESCRAARRRVPQRPPGRGGACATDVGHRASSSTTNART